MTNGLQFDVREALYALLGVDLTQIYGLGPYVAVKLISECGTTQSLVRALRRPWQPLRALARIVYAVRGGNACPWLLS